LLPLLLGVIFSCLVVYQVGLNILEFMGVPMNSPPGWILALVPLVARIGLFIIEAFFSVLAILWRELRGGDDEE